jgi:CubicO group peptidase (beta-lactamase class C family)
MQPTSRPDRQRLRRLENQYQQLRRLLRIPGMSAAIVKDEKLIWSKGFGYADVEKRIPATPKTLYYIASLTKTFATTALMQLVERGELDLDEPMSKYSNEFKDDTVKVKHVLSHTAAAPPGERFRYDGARFASLTAVIEKKTGKSFRDLMTEMFLEPLQMTDSVPSQDVVKVAPKNAGLYSNEKLYRYRRSLNRFAKPYRLYGNEIIHTSYPWEGLSTSAGLLSSAPDLAKFVIAIDRHVYLKRETQARSWAAFISNSGRPLPHGLGWFVQDYEGVKCVWHFGNDPFEFSGTLVMVPEKRLALILLANSDALSSVFLRGGILHTSAFVTSFLRLFIFEEKLKVSLPDPHWGSDKKAFESELTELSERANAYSYEGEKKGYAAMHAWLSDNQKRALKAVQVDPRTFDAYVGEYQLPDGNVLIVSRDGDRLMIQQRGESKIELFSESSTRFFTKAVDAELMFVKGADCKITQMELYQGGTVVLKKIK